MKFDEIVERRTRVREQLITNVAAVCVARQRDLRESLTIVCARVGDNGIMSVGLPSVAEGD